MTSKPPETWRATPDSSHLLCNKLSDAKAIVKPYLGNDFTSRAGNAAVGGSMQTGVAGDTLFQVTVRLPMPI